MKDSSLTNQNELDPLATKAIELVYEGQSTRQISKTLDKSWGAILGRIAKSEELAEQYARAKTVKGMQLADEVVEDLEALDPETCTEMELKIALAKSEAKKWTATKFWQYLNLKDSKQPNQQVNIQATGDSRIVIQTAQDVNNQQDNANETQSQQAIDV